MKMLEFQRDCQVVSHHLSFAEMKGYLETVLEHPSTRWCSLSNLPQRPVTLRLLQSLHFQKLDLGELWEIGSLQAVSEWVLVFLLSAFIHP